MFSLSLELSQDVIKAGEGTLQAALYGQLLESYTPCSGPSAGTALDALQWVYYSGADYAAVSGESVPGFASYTSAGTQQLSLPAVQIQSAHLIFGVGSLPAIGIDASGAPIQPSPVGVGSDGIYDFVEFTYNYDSGADEYFLYLNTTMIDQFGLPIQIQLSPSDAVLPAGAGVSLSRGEVFSQFSSYVQAHNADFAQCAQDMFGQPLSTRLLSPKYALTGNCVQGVVANAFSGPASTLPAGSYYYAVTALDSEGHESYAQYQVVQASSTGAQPAIQVAWAPNQNQSDSAIASYNVYRGSYSGQTLSWGLIGNLLASTLGANGGALADTGQTATDQAPSFNPLATGFDSEIQTFFARYQSGDPLVLTSTDGSGNGYVYSFSGQTRSNAAGQILSLDFSLTAVTDSKGQSVALPPIPLQTPFQIFYPFWNTNSYDPSLPAPPSWTLYPLDSASTMVFAAEGVFADNQQQIANNLPSGVEDAKTYGILLGALENQIVAALTRGIANLSGVSPQNWGNGTAPNQLQPVLSAGPSSLQPGQAYYYVITAVNAQGETFPSFEFTATPSADQPAVTLNWQPLDPATVSAFNIYRGTASQQQNLLVATVANSSQGQTTSFVDQGQSVAAQSPPAYFPAGVFSSTYDAFFHQPGVSLNGAAYAGPYDDQGGQSSTISTAAPTAASVILGLWNTLA